MTTVVKDKATSREADLAKLKAQAKKKTAVAALKQKKAEAAAEEKKKQDEVEYINLDNLTKETKEIGEEEKRAIEEEEKKIRGIAPNEKTRYMINCHISDGGFTLLILSQFKDMDVFKEMDVIWEKTRYMINCHISGYMTNRYIRP